MKDKMKEDDNQAKILAVLLLAVVAGVTWLLAITHAYPKFQNTWLTEPLAVIYSLGPLYYVAILLIALLAIACFIFRIENTGVHILLLMMFAIMLWYTPYYLAGFARFGDTPAWLGISMWVPEILDGQYVLSSFYVETYPAAFTFNYILLTVTDIRLEDYLAFFPLFVTLLFTLLWYAFVSNLFGKRVAFVSLLIAIPGLHSMALRPAPSTIGLLLLLTILLLLFKRDVSVRAIAMAITGMVALIIMHAMWPLLLLFFLGAGLVSNVTRKFGWHRSRLATMLFLGAVGYLFYLFWLPGPSKIAEGAIGVVQHLIYYGRLETVEHYLAGTPFIYGGIYNLRRGIYLLYGAITIILLLYTLISTYFQQGNIRKWRVELGGFSRGQIFLILLLHFVSGLTALTMQWGGEAGGTFERGLIFLVLLSSCLIASLLVKFYPSNILRALPNSGLLTLVIFLTLSFPIVAYATTAFANYPISEKQGLKFLAESVPLDNKSLAGGMGRQILFFPEAASSRLRFEDIGHQGTGRAGDLDTHISMFRQTDYYWAAMSRDLSFEDNAFTRHLATIAGSDGHNYVYSNPAFQVFLKASR